MVCDYEIKDNAIIVNCSGCVFGSNLEDFDVCFAKTMDKIIESGGIEKVILSGTREYEYDYQQTKLITEIAQVYDTLVNKKNILNYSSLGKENCERCLPKRFAELEFLLNQMLRKDPIGAYVRTNRMIRSNLIKVQKENTACKRCYLFFVKNALLPIKEELENTTLIRMVKDRLQGFRLSDRSLYREIFTPLVRPKFMLTRFMPIPPKNGRFIERYKIKGTIVEIFKIPGTARNYYFLSPPEFRLSDEKYSILDIARTQITERKPTEAELTQPERAREMYTNISKDTVKKLAMNFGLTLNKDELDEMAEILTRHTFGFGILEVLLTDEKVQDIYINSPVGSMPVYIGHDDFEECETNILPTKDEAEGWSTRFRLLSGRPFDEANPVLDTELFVPGGRARVCAITKTLAPEGIGYALRRHREKPWTYPLFLNANFFDPLFAGLMGFFVDGARSLLISGGRGSGKTSLLAATLLEIMKKFRIVTVEDTLEIPVIQLRDLGYNIERLKSRSVITKVEMELAADEALRTAIRLGDACLIVGEVRSSVRGNEEVVIVDNHVMKRVQIKNLEKKDLKKVYVPTLDFDLKVNLSKLTNFVKHPKRGKLLKIKTKTGREVTVTHDHSLFTSTKNFEIAPIECKNLKIGDQIVIPSRMTCGFNDIDTINIFDYLPEFGVQNFEKDVRRAIKILGWRRATEVCKIKAGDVYNYFRTNQKTNILFSSFNNLMSVAGLDFEPENLEVKKGTSFPIPASIPVNEDFCRFLGYYVSEGYYSLKCGGIIVITNSNQEIIDDITEISQKLFKKSPRRRVVKGLGSSVQNQLNCLSLARLISKLGCGRTCSEKRVPPIIFGLSKRKIAAFLRGLYSGDGSFTGSIKSGNCVRYYSTSKKLIEDVAYLLLNFGIVAAIRERKPTSCGKNNMWILEFKDRKMVEIFLDEIGFKGRKIKVISKKWPHTKSNSVKFDREALRRNLIKYPRKYRHLFRFLSCSKNYLKKVVEDPKCEVSEKLKSFALGDFFLDEVKEIKEIKLGEAEHVYDLSVAPTENFVGGFGGILLHNTEAAALYEAMRIGALTNVVAGTIHGESAYGVFDRVVNDLKVPTTSFKATDIIVVCGRLRSADGLHTFRRVVEVTEVRKRWKKDPVEENGFVNLMEYSAKEDKLKPTSTLINGESFIINEIAKRVKEWHGNWDAIWSNIELRGRIKKAMVDYAKKLKRMDILEADWVSTSNEMFHIFSNNVNKELGSLDSEEIFKRWDEWFRSRLK